MPLQVDQSQQIIHKNEKENYCYSGRLNQVSVILNGKFSLHVEKLNQLTWPAPKCTCSFYYMNNPGASSSGVSITGRNGSVGDSLDESDQDD